MRAAEHHDATFELYIRRWGGRYVNAYRRVRFVSMTRTMGLKCFAGASPIRNLLRGRRILLLCDEIEDWSAVQLLAVASHCEILIAAGDEDQSLRPVHRRVQTEPSAQHDVLQPMQTEAPLSHCVGAVSCTLAVLVQIALLAMLSLVSHFRPCLRLIPSSL